MYGVRNGFENRERVWRVASCVMFTMFHPSRPAEGGREEGGDEGGEEKQGEEVAMRAMREYGARCEPVYSMRRASYSA